MGTTKIDIINLALAKLMVEPVNDLVVGPPKISSLSSSYDNLKPTLLTKSYWRFASKIQRLSRLSEPSDNPNYLYMYEIPPDCLAIYKVFIGPYAYEYYYEKIGTRIYSNYQSLTLQYTYPQIETNFPQSFVNYFSLYLAAENGMLFTQSAEITKGLYEAAQVAFVDAAAIDAMQSPDTYPTNYQIINTRFLE